MSTTREEGGGASSGTQPSMITVPVSIPLPERMDLSGGNLDLLSGNNSVERGQIRKSYVAQLKELYELYQTIVLSLFGLFWTTLQIPDSFFL